jgi:hypothetical protein
MTSQCSTGSDGELRFFRSSNTEIRTLPSYEVYDSLSKTAEGAEKPADVPSLCVPPRPLRLVF